ncbi:MAG TPA: tetratricopeptide repeat protein [Gemmatimonadaceae bacterium]|nr:tetratricopeptide repeat protein [Gemmatimonadaceae bacterium]
MRTTMLTQIPARRATVLSLSATMLALAACGGDEERPASTGDVPVVSAVASGVSSGTTTETPRVDYSTISYETAESTYLARDYGQATAMFSSYVERKPENPWGHYMLGLSAWKAGDRDRARSALERSLELDPTHVKTLLNLGRVLLEQDRAGEAKERVLAALALDSTSGEVHRMLGRVHTALGVPDDAIAAYRTSLAHDPADAWSMNNLALIFIQQERYDEALGPLARAVQIRPGAPVFQNNLGIALERTGHVGAAREAYRAAIAADSGYRKAVESLTRLEGVEDDPAAVPVELSVLADAFEREVQRWREERMAAIVPDLGVAVSPGGLTIVPDTVEVPMPEPMPPR